MPSPTFRDSATGAITSSDTVTTSSIDGGTDVIYFCHVSCRPLRDVISVSGGGLDWQPLTNGIPFCHARGQLDSDMWYAFGSPASAFQVTVTVSSSTNTLVSVVSAYDDSDGTVSDFITANTNGTFDPENPSGYCANGTDNSPGVITYNVSDSSDAKVVVFNSPRNRTISSVTPSSTYVERDFSTGGSSGDLINVYLYDAEVDSTGNHTATFSHSASDWAIAAIVLHGGESSEPPVELNVDSANHPHSLDTVSLIQANALSVDGITHAHGVDHITLDAGIQPASNVVATAINHSRVDLSWTKGVDATQYVIQRIKISD